MTRFNPDEYRLFVIKAISPSGSTFSREIVQGLNKLTEEVESLLESDHDVTVYECIERKFETSKKFTVTFVEDK